jgi:hypothetical protein
VLIAVVLALGVAGPAQAVVLIDTAGRTPQPYQRWADEAHVPTVPGAIGLIGSPCPSGAKASCTWFGGPIYLPGSHSLAQRQTLYHELGHQFDMQMPQWVRDRFEAIMGLGPIWVRGPRELFAEGYSACGLGGHMARLAGYGGVYGYDPTHHQNQAVCQLIRGLHH